MNRYGINEEGAINPILNIEMKKKTAIIFAAALIIIITFFSFLNCLKNGFVSWDDDIYVTNNPLIRDLSLKGIIKIFTTIHFWLYKPLAIFSFALEYHFFKLAPGGYHAVNLALHLFNCALVFSLIFILTGKLEIGFIVGILFGVHPLHAESVAWVSELKDVLYSLFFLSGLIFYFYSEQGARRKFHYLAVLSFVLSLLVKPMGIVFPFILLLCDYLLRRKISIKNKIIFFVIAGGFLLFTFCISSEYISEENQFSHFDSLLIANYSLLFYLAKLILPISLSVIYPLPQKSAGALPLAFFIAPLAVFLLGLSVFLSKRYTKKLIFGSLFFLICVLPALQLVPSGNAIVADRYSYLPSIGIFYIAAVSIEWFYKVKLKNQLIGRVLAWGILIITVGTFSFLTRQRCNVWQNDATFWEDAVKMYPPDVRERIVFYTKELEKHPDSLEAYNNLAVSYGNIGNHRYAILLCLQAIKLYPDSAAAYNNLAAAYGYSRNFARAIESALKAVELNPGYASAYNNLAVAYFYSKRYLLAQEYAQKALSYGYEVDPGFLQALKKYSK